MAESCKYCDSELSPMDGVYIQSELHMSPQKIQKFELREAVKRL